MGDYLHGLSKEKLIKMLQDARDENARLANYLINSPLLPSEINNNLSNRTHIDEKDKYKLFFESIPIGGYFSDVNGRFLKVNPAFVNILGYQDAAELMAVNISTDIFANKSDREKILKSADSEQYTVANYIAKTRDGREILIEDHIRFIRNDHGDLVYLEGICQDVTKRREIETALLQSEERFRVMAEMLPQAVWETDVTGCFTYVNPAGFSISGYSPDDIQDGKLSIFEVIAPEDRQRVAENAKALFEGAKKDGTEYQAIKKDGTRYPVIIYTGLAKANGLVTGIRGITVDISDVRNKEEVYLATRAQLQSVLDAATEVSIIAVDSSGIVRIFNKGAEKMLGYSPDEVVGKVTPLKFHLESEIKVLVRELLLETGDVYNGFKAIVARADKVGSETREWTYVCKNRTRIAVSLVVSVVKDPAGAIIGYLGVGRNITEHKLAQKTLVESELKYRTLFENLSDAIFIMNSQVILDCNTRIKDFFKCDKDYIIGSSLVKFSPPFQPDGEKSDVKAAFYIKAAMSGVSQHFEWVYRRLDGVDFYAEVSLNRIIIGKEPLIQVIVRDIDERKKSEVRLLKSKQLFQTLANISPVGIFRTDEKGRTTFVNPKWIELSGLTEDEAMGDNWLDAVHPDDRPMLIQHWKDKSAKGDESTAEYRFVKDNGSVVWVMGYAVPEIIDGVVKGYVGTITDISDRKRTEIELQEKNQLIESQNQEYLKINDELIKLNEELLRAKLRAEESDRLKSSFLANMSHEIRTPLNGIIGFAHVLSALELTEDERREYTDTLHLSCNRLLNTVNDILDISRIDAGQTVLNPANYHPAKLLDELFALQVPNYKKKGIDLKLENKVKIKDFEVFGDEQKIYQVINNLIDNALKFTKQGFVAFGVSAINDKIEYYVADTGIGIAKEHLEFVFGRFNQENVMFNREHEGTGLGLAITKGLVELMGGKIYLESEKGKGSIFRIVLPLKLPK
jgi:PAS domain S-box-containing protein